MVSGSFRLFVVFFPIEIPVCFNANTVEPDYLLHSGTFDLGLHYLPRYHCMVTGISGYMNKNISHGGDRCINSLVSEEIKPVYRRL